MQALGRAGRGAEPEKATGAKRKDETRKKAKKVLDKLSEM